MVGTANKNQYRLKPHQVSALIEAGILTKNTMGLKDRDFDKIYAKAKQLYDSGKYKEARPLFSMLCLFDKKKPSYIYGFASSSMLMNDLDLAIDAFYEYGRLVQNDPFPYYYIATCYEKKNDLFSTIIALQTVVGRAGNQSQYQTLKNRALLALANYSKTNK